MSRNDVECERRSRAATARLEHRRAGFPLVLFTDGSCYRWPLLLASRVRDSKDRIRSVQGLLYAQVPLMDGDLSIETYKQAIRRTVSDWMRHLGRRERPPRSG